MTGNPKDITASLAAGTISTQEAAQQLARPARDAFEKDGDLGKVEHELEGAWAALTAAAAQTPHDGQDALVDVVHAIAAMPHPTHAAVEGAKKFEIWGEELRWEQLPLFGAKTREGLDIGNSKKTPPPLLRGTGKIGG